MTNGNLPADKAAGSISGKMILAHHIPSSTGSAELVDAVLCLDLDGVVVLSDSIGFTSSVPQQLPTLEANEIAARCSAVTDAIKRVEGASVRETVDRDQLRIVEFPIVIPVVLARKVVLAQKWAESGDARGAVSVAGLLSELSAVEPRLVVIELEEPNV